MRNATSKLSDDLEWMICAEEVEELVARRRHYDQMRSGENW